MPDPATQLEFSGIEIGWELLTVEEDKQTGRFTADLLASRADRLAAVVAALGEGMSIRSVARAYGISVNTVLAAKRRFGERIEAEKQRLGRDCFDVARMAAERVREEIDLMPRASLPIVLGVFAEKGLLLTGAPTARVEHTGGPTVRSLADYIEALPSAIPVVEGEEAGQKGALSVSGIRPGGLPTHIETAALLRSPEESGADGPISGPNGVESNAAP